jgi:hypothetical protein
MFQFPAESCATPADIVAITAPLDVIPLTATSYVIGPPVTVTVFVPPAVPLMVTPLLLKPVTGSLKMTVKLIGETLVGSACPAAWLIVTVGIAESTIVMSLATLLAGELSPPPDTVAVLVTIPGALPSTFTTKVIGG